MMTYWPDVINEVRPGATWVLHDSYSLDSLEIEVDGVLRPANVNEKRYLQSKVEEVAPIINARLARRAKVKKMLEEFEPDVIYSVLLDDAKLDALKTRVREINGG